MNIVFLHGLAGSKQYFVELEKQLGQRLGARTLSFDLLGFGYNRYAKSNFTAEDHVEFISHQVQQAFGHESIVVVGHSLGGVLTLLWAKAYPHRIQAIVLLNTPLGQTREEVTASIGDIRQNSLGWGYLILKHRSLAFLSCNLLCRFNLMRLFRAAKPAFIPDAVFEDYHKHTWTSLTKTFEQVVLANPAKPILLELANIPVLILAGAGDNALMRVNPHRDTVEYKELPGGHFTSLEHPDETTQVISNFLRQHLL